MRLVLMVFLCALLSSCVVVKTHWGFMGPNTYEATDGNVSVAYYNGNCCCIAKEVLEYLAHEANYENFDWSKMADEAYQKKVLDDTCWSLKNMPNFK